MTPDGLAAAHAWEVGRRHAPDPIVLTVRARAAWQAGVKFYQPEERLFLAAEVPAEFVQESEPDVTETRRDT